MIPLILKLKRNAHKEIAKVQDLVVEMLFSVFNDAVMHGGTSIWRCYNGNRFSEDIDVYIPRDLSRLDILFQKFQKVGFVIEKKKIGENSLYSNLKLNNVSVRFEALFKKAKGHLREYETVEGNSIVVSTLTPDELINEKVQTYQKRRKIRDLYDIFFLLKYAEDRIHVKKDIAEMLKNFSSPIDEKDLQTIIIIGLVPTTAQMREYLERWK